MMKWSARSAGTTKEQLKPVAPTNAKWGEQSQDHYGYASEEERRAKRGLEDWELLETVPQSQNNVPTWFIAVVVVVLLVAVGLSFPFWGDRPGYEREWINWGFGAAIVYVTVGSIFVYFMVRLFSVPPHKPEDKGAEKSGQNSSAD